MGTRDHGKRERHYHQDCYQCPSQPASNRARGSAHSPTPGTRHTCAMYPDLHWERDCPNTPRGPSIKATALDHLTIGCLLSSLCQGHHVYFIHCCPKLLSYLVMSPYYRLAQVLMMCYMCVCLLDHAAICFLVLPDCWLKKIFNNTLYIVILCWEKISAAKVVSQAYSGL